MRVSCNGLIGLSGKKRSGKDTVGGILVRDHGFTRASFADKLREVALALDPIIDVEPGDPPLEVRLSEVVDHFGWEVAKDRFKEVRRTLQRLGTEAGRNVLGEHIWVKAAFRNLDFARYVFTDVRFPNEAQAIKDRGGEVWRIHRPSPAGLADALGLTNTTDLHPSESALDDWEFDHHIFNTSTLKSLALSVATHVISGQEKSTTEA